MVPTTRFKVTTESGRVYFIRSGGTVQVCDKGTEAQREAFKEWALVDRNLLIIKNLLPGENVFQAAHRVKVGADKPLVGMSLFCYSFGSWRISTPIKTVLEMN